MSDLGYELGWDDELEYQDSSFVIVPEGDYDFEVIEFERARHPGSDRLPPCNKAVLKLRLTNGPNGESTTIFHNLFLHTRTAGLLSNFFVGIGQMAPGEKIRMNWNAVVGARGRAKVGVRKWVDQNGQERESNQIVRFYEPGEAPSTRAVPSTPQTTYQPGSF